MDIQMPEMDGITATQQIRNRWPKIKQPRIIAMTANAMKGDRERYLAKGMDDYLSKPIEIEELARILKESQPLLERRGAAAEGATRQRRRGDMPAERGRGTSEEGAIDLQVVKKMLGEAAWDILPDMMAIFFEETPTQLANLRQAITDNDSKTVERFAHILKGSSAITGATTLSSYSETLMMMARQGELQEALQQLAKIEAEYKQVQETWDLMQTQFY